MQTIRPDLVAESQGQKKAVFNEQDNTMTIYEVDAQPGLYRFIERLSRADASGKYGDSKALRTLALSGA